MILCSPVVKKIQKITKILLNVKKEEEEWHWSDSSSLFMLIEFRNNNTDLINNSVLDRYKITVSLIMTYENTICPSHKNIMAFMIYDQICCDI